MVRNRTLTGIVHRNPVVRLIERASIFLKFLASFCEFRHEQIPLRVVGQWVCHEVRRTGVAFEFRNCQVGESSSEPFSVPVYIVTMQDEVILALLFRLEQFSLDDFKGTITPFPKRYDQSVRRVDSPQLIKSDRAV